MSETKPNQQETLEKAYKRQDIFETQRLQNDERVARFFSVASRDIKSFFKRIFGTNYIPQNDFSYNQKQKILEYIYFKNNVDMAKPRVFSHLRVENNNTKESIENRIQHYNEMKDYNRSFFIYNLAKCQNRINYTGIFNLFLLFEKSFRVHLGNIQFLHCMEFNL